MPIVVKDARGKKVLAEGVIGNSIRCGHCDFPIQDNCTWIALDDPYWCLIHETCRPLFKYNGQMRTDAAEGRLEAKKDIDRLQRVLHGMITKPWWQNSANTKKYHAAIRDMLLLHQSLRSARVIRDADVDALVGIPATAQQQTQQQQAQPPKITRERLAAVFNE